MDLFVGMSESSINRYSFRHRRVDPRISPPILPTDAGVG